MLVLPNATSFVCYQIHFGKGFFFCTMAVVLVKEATLIVTMDDLDFGIKDVTFEAKVLNGGQCVLVLI